MRIRRYFSILLCICFALAASRCARLPKHQNSKQSGINISVESPDKDEKRGGQTTLEDVNKINTGRDSKELPKPGVFDRLKDFILKLKIPF